MVYIMNVGGKGSHANTNSLLLILIMTNKQRRDLVAYAKELTKHGKHQAAQSVLELLNEGR